MTGMRYRSLIAAVATTACSGLVACSSSDKGSDTMAQRRTEAIATLHQVWPALSAAADPDADPTPVASGAYEQCADDGSTMAYGVYGHIPAKKASPADPVITQLADVLTRNGYTAQPTHADAQALRFVKADALVNVYAEAGRFALEIRSTCSDVSDELRNKLLGSETLEGTLSPEPSTSSS
ncbi:MAG: hypothetical protein JWM93_1027 [Frankiales bacterium]|nr:hypothetical protein [Frankiales bacterium]